MKFAVYAALVASACAEMCDPAKLAMVFFEDSECANPNEALNKEYSTVKKADYPMYELGCHEINGNSCELYCDGEGLHETIYEDSKC